MKLDPKSTDLIASVFAKPTGDRPKPGRDIGRDYVEWCVRAIKPDGLPVRIVDSDKFRLVSTGDEFRVLDYVSFVPARMVFDRLDGELHALPEPDGGKPTLQRLTIRTGDHVETAMTDGAQWVAGAPGYRPDEVVRFVDLVIGAHIRAATLDLPGPTFELNDTRTPIEGFSTRDLVSAIENWKSEGKPMRFSRKVATGGRFRHPWRKPIVDRKTPPVAPQSRPVEIGGVRYPSLKAARTATGFSLGLIRRRLDRKQPGFAFVD